MKTKPIKIYKNGVGIYEVIKELQRQEFEMLRGGENGKHARLLDEDSVGSIPTLAAISNNYL
jgi:hypothetical protein